MAENLKPKSLHAAAYIPTAPRTGSEGGFLYRMKNMILRGAPTNDYLEVYGGNKNLFEDLAELVTTGIANVAVGSLIVTGVGTAFRAELRPGQPIFITGTPPILGIIDEILSDTALTLSHVPIVSATGQPLNRTPVIFEVDKKRGTLITGNAIRFDKGTIIAVGTGTLRLNGAVLPGTSLVAGKRPKIAIYDPNAGTYAVFPLGMATPATLAAAAVAGGLKNMLTGVYSLFIVPARRATNGYNNPSPKAEVTIATGDVVRLTIPAVDTANGQDAWRIYASTFTEQGGVNGPWYFVRQINAPGDVLAAGGTYDLEWNDAEINRNELLSFDNDAPVDCEFVATVAGYPVYVSCQGQGYSTAVPSTSPGPFIIPSKPNNIEAAPLKFGVSPSPPESIIGCISAQGRLYLMTANTLQVALFVPTNDPNIPPLTIRPYWRAGFKHPYQLCFVDGTLYGFTTQGPTRSVSYGDEGKEEHTFAAAVKEITATWDPAKVFVAHDPINNAVCFFHSADNLNAAGSVTSRVLMYGMDRQAWIGDITLELAGNDMIVTGVATVNGRLEFIAGGRTSGIPSILFRTFHFDANFTLDGGAGVAVPWYAAWQFTDDGSEVRDKTVKAIRVTGKLSALATAGVHGAGAGEVINVPVLEAGNGGSKSGSIPLAATAAIGQGPRIPVNVPNLGVWTVRIDDTWDGSFISESRIDEVVVERSVGGVRR